MYRFNDGLFPSQHGFAVAALNFLLHFIPTEVAVVSPGRLSGV